MVAALRDSMTASGGTPQKSEIFSNFLGEWHFGAADENVWRDTDLAKLHDAVLGRLGLHFVPRPNLGNEGYVDVERVFNPELRSHLPDRFQEWQALNVTNRAADLGNDHVRLLLFGQVDDSFLDLVGDVRDDLDGCAQVVAAALGLDDA